MAKKIQSRESAPNGHPRFALTLATHAACQRAQREEAKREERRAQVRSENADWAAAHGIDESELNMLFA